MARSSAAAATQGDVVAERMRPTDVRWLSNKLRAAGCDVVEGPSHVRVVGRPLRAVDVTTWPHPGFATDLQSQYAALMTQAEGVSVVSEAVFENRFRHADQLRLLGAQVTVEGRSAVISGPTRLRGARVVVPDIRSGAALVIAALCAEGTSQLENAFHLDRGYEDLDGKLCLLGAQLERLRGTEAEVAIRDFSGVVGD